MARRRSVPKELVSLLSQSPRPIYVLDDDRRVLFCNPACCEWLGTDADSLIGKRCDYQASRTAEGDLAAVLCPPPEAFSGTAVQADLVAPGGTSRRRANFLPLGELASDASGVIAVLAAEDSGPPGDPADDTPGAAELHCRLQELHRQIRSPYRLERMVGESVAIRRVRDQIRVAIDGQARVAVIGPPGSGCEHVARTIHCGHDSAAAGPLMPLSCARLDGELLQTTVTAFLRRCRELAAGVQGTLLLLDVEQLQLDAQLELLAFLQLPTFGLRTIVTARSSLVEAGGQEGLQRELALLLSTLEIRLPPLAERRSDIPYLAQQFLEEANVGRRSQLSGFSTETLDRLCGMPWQGDVDELAEMVRQACRDATGPIVGTGDLPRRVELLASAAAYPPPQDESIKLDEFLVEIEAELIRRALRRARGNKAQAARLLGISRARLIRRVDQLKLEAPP